MKVVKLVSFQWEHMLNTKTRVLAICWARCYYNISCSNYTNALIKQTIDRLALNEYNT